MKSRPVRAEVCLGAGKTASRGKTKPGNCGKIGRKGEKIRLEDAIRLEMGVFPQPLKSCPDAYPQTESNFARGSTFSNAIALEARRSQ